MHQQRCPYFLALPILHSIIDVIELIVQTSLIILMTLLKIHLNLTKKKTLKKLNKNHRFNQLYYEII